MPGEDPSDLASWPAAEAVTYLLDQHGGRLYQVGLRLCGDPSDAEDLVQEVFLQAFRKWHQYRGDAKPTTWLYSIASRACRRRHRRRAGEPRSMASFEALLPDPSRGVPDLRGPTVDALDEQCRRQAREAVEAAVAALPEHFRMPLILKEIVELPVAEVAAILGLQKATVKTRLHRARLALRKALDERLPHRDAAAPDHARRICLDLLAAKQEAMDRDLPFAVSDTELCERCRTLFDTLDLARDVCQRLAAGEVPAPLRERVLSTLAAS